MTASNVRRVALVCPSDDYVGPALVVELARRGYDVVCGGLVHDDVRDAVDIAGGRLVDVATRPHDLDAGSSLVDAARREFGTFHSAFFSSGRIALGRFLKTSADDLRGAVEGNVVAPYAYVQAVLPTLLEQRDGQILVATSATAGRPTAGASLYAGTRSAATTMLQSAALEFADTNVQLNVVGTNFMDFPGFLAGNRATTPEGRARVESLVPMKRLGTMTEFAAFCATLLDASSRFQTGQFFPYAGGWNV